MRALRTLGLWRLHYFTSWAFLFARGVCEQEFYVLGKEMCGTSRPLVSNVFWFFWKIFVEFWPEKYDFNLHKGFLMKKIAQIRQILKKKNSKFSEFYNKFQCVAKNIEGLWVFSTFIYSIQPNLAKGSYGWFPLQLHHKIKNKNPAGEIF